MTEKLILMIGVLSIIIFITLFNCLNIGNINYLLNLKRSTKKTVNLSSIMMFFVPTEGGYHWYSLCRSEYKTYKIVVIMGLINSLLVGLTVIVSLLLIFLTRFHVFYLFRIPALYAVIIILVLLLTKFNVIK